jgi:hypothetical protein
VPAIRVVGVGGDALPELEEADSWENLRLPAAVRRRLCQTDETPVEFVDTVRYRLLCKS